MAKSIKTEAIVLRKRNLLNRDKLITLFTKELGKINIFAKGIKKITSRRLPHVQTANLINCIIQEKSSIYYLSETVLISGFSKIKKSTEKINDLYIFLFVLERLLPEHQAELEVYILTKKYLKRLSETDHSTKILLTEFLNKLLSLLGYINRNESYYELVAKIEEIIHEKVQDLRI